jgi:hypothetical protein
MPDPVPSTQIQQAIQHAYDAPRGPQRLRDHAWLDRIATPTTLVLAGVGVAALLIPSLNRARGATLSARLRFAQRAQEVQNSIDPAHADASHVRAPQSASDKL